MLNARKIPGPPSFVAARCSRVPLMASSGRIWPSLTEPTALWAPSSTHLSWRSGFGWLGDFHGVFTWVWQGLVDKIEVPKLQNTNGICNIPSHTTPPPKKHIKNRIWRISSGLCLPLPPVPPLPPLPPLRCQVLCRTTCSIRELTFHGDDPNGATTPTTTTATTSAGPVATTEATTESTTGSVNRSLEYVGFKSNYIVAKWWVKFD